LCFRALGRAGKAYLKKGDETNGLKFLNKSLSEHRMPDIARQINEVLENVYGTKIVRRQFWKN